MKIHNVFHTDLLLPYKEMEVYGTPFTHPPPIIDNEEEYEVEAILDARRKGRGRQLQYLVHWKGYPHSDDSWIMHKDLHAPELLTEFMLSNPATAGRVTTRLPSLFPFSFAIACPLPNVAVVANLLLYSSRRDATRAWS